MVIPQIDSAGPVSPSASRVFLPTFCERGEPPTGLVIALIRQLGVLAPASKSNSDDESCAGGDPRGLFVIMEPRRKGWGGMGSYRPAVTFPNASGMNRFSSEPVGPSVFLVSCISAVALVSAETMNNYAGDVVTVGAGCAGVQVSVHSSPP